MAKVLVFSNIRVFDEAGIATGPGLRAWGIAGALAERGHTVTLAEPAGGRGSRDAAGWDALIRIEWSRGDLELRRWVEAVDVVIVQPGIQIANALRGIGPRCLVVDLYNPVVTEFMASAAPGEAGVRPFGDMLRWYRSFLHRGDVFLCAGERQRQFTLGALAHAGRLNPLTCPDELVRLVPMGVDPAPLGEAGAERLLRGPIVSENAELLLWPGGIYRWFEAVTAVRAMARVRERRPRAELVFVGAENPLNPGASGRGAAAAVGAAREQGLLGAGVTFAPWQPYERRSAIYREADLGILSHRPLLEAHLSWRTRTLDCLWGGLPLVVTAGDEVGEIAARHGAALVVPPEDPESMAAAIVRLLEEPDRRQAMREAARRLAVETWSWRRVTEPLHEVCLNPRAAADRIAVDRCLGIGRAARLPGLTLAALMKRVAARAARPLRPWAEALDQRRKEVSRPQQTGPSVTDAA